MRVLLCQFSSDLINRDIPPEPYYDRMYSALEGEGYFRPVHFWEIPQWCALIAGNLKRTSAECEFRTITNVLDFMLALNREHWDVVCFSVLDVNRELVRNVLELDNGRTQFALGGYVDSGYFSRFPNVRWFESVPAFVESLGYSYSEVYDYSHFKGVRTVPRLSLSTGCMHRCKFCTIAGSGVEPVPDDVVWKQALSFSPLKFELVYLNDKTFGQSPNYRLLPELYALIRGYNPSFKGFVIQTTCAQWLRCTDSFLRDSGIRFVELGVESVNDDILRTYRKPSSESLIARATERFRQFGDIRLVVNLVVGFPEETRGTYSHTLGYLYSNVGLISHLNVYNLAVYAGTELSKRLGTEGPNGNEGVTVKTFHSDPSVHEWAHARVMECGEMILDHRV